MYIAHLGLWRKSHISIIPLRQFVSLAVFFSFRVEGLMVNRYTLSADTKIWRGVCYQLPISKVDSEWHCLSEFSRIHCSELGSDWLNSKSHIWNQNTDLFTYGEIKHQEANIFSPLFRAFSSYRYINYPENQVVTMKQLGEHRLKTKTVSFMKWMLNSIRLKFHNVFLSTIRSLAQIYQILGWVLKLSGTFSLPKWF